MFRRSTKKNAIFFVFVAVLATINADDCVPRDFSYGSIVCVCNATYCDSAPVIIPPRGQFRTYESSRAGRRMLQETGQINNESSEDNSINRLRFTLNPNRTYQSINGFGGAFTDAAGINIRTLSTGAQNLLMEAYFGVNGSRYSLGRVPIGGTDFSTRVYSLDDSMYPDVGLANFALANEDYDYKIPLMQRARRLNPNLRFISAAWSAPAWMKTNDNLRSPGLLLPQYYQVYADYLVRFLMAYKQNGLDIWAISTGNEPDDYFDPFIIKFNNMGWLPHDMARWVGDNLGPTIERSGSNETIIVMLDDQRFNLPWYPAEVLKNPNANRYIAGIGVHWYFDNFFPPSLLDLTHDRFPDKFILNTEACEGSQLWAYPRVRLGDWDRGERYILDIMQDLNHWMTGWIDWNLALNEQGGPNWVDNFVDSPIIVNAARDEFYKQPMFYALAHFSKFIPPGSTRIGLTDSIGVQGTSFLTPDNNIVIVIYNRNVFETNVTIVDPEQGNISVDIGPQTIKTIIYRR